MKLSIFNIYNKNNQECFVYNTYSSAFIKVSRTTWETIVNIIQTTEPIPANLNNTIKKLSENGIIIEDNIDEVKKFQYRYYSKMFNNQSLNIFVAPTMKCNFKCFYCFEEGNKNDGLISNEIANNLVHFIANQKNKKIVIHWFGGEPLLGFKQILNISRQLNERDIEYSSTIITNGSLLTPKNIKYLKELNLQYIQISLDGIAENHDKRRIFKNGKASFSLIISNLRNLMNTTNIKVCIQVTVDHSNETAYKDIVDYMQINFKTHIESKRITIGHNYVLNRTNFDNSELCYTPNQILQNEINSIKNQSGTIPEPCLPGLAYPCMFRRKNSYAIDSKGYIYQCIEHLGNQMYKVGDLNSGKINLDKIITNRFSNLPFEDEKCKVCAYLPICGGGCPIDRMKVQKGLSQSFCSIHKTKLTSLLPYIYEIKYKKH